MVESYKILSENSNSIDFTIALIERHICTVLPLYKDHSRPIFYSKNG